MELSEILSKCAFVIRLLFIFPAGSVRAACRNAFAESDADCDADACARAFG